MSRMSSSSSMSAAAASSSSASSKGGLLMGLAAGTVTAAIAAAAALYYAYKQDASKAAAAPAAKKGGKVAAKKGGKAGAVSAAGAASVAAAAAAAAANAVVDAGGRWDDAAFTAALHRDIEARSTSTGRVNPQSERRLWGSVRRLGVSGNDDALRAYAPTTRTEIAQWIVAYHANLGAGQQGLLSPDQTTGPRAERRAADYEIAWRCFSTVEVELAALEKPQPEQIEMRKDVELAMLDLAHKQRNNERLLNFYDRVRSRADPRDPSGYSEMEFFTLWMLSPLVGRWGDFVAWADFMLAKGQPLDEFHHLAIQRPDLTDFKQMYAMVKEQQQKAAASLKEAEDAAAAALAAPAPAPSVEAVAASAEEPVAAAAAASEEEAAAPAPAAMEEVPAAAAPERAASEEVASVAGDDAVQAGPEAVAAEVTATAVGLVDAIEAIAADAIAAEAAAPAAAPVAAAAPAAAPVAAAAVVPLVTMWSEPSAAELEWSLWDIVGVTWTFVSSSGSDSESLAMFCKGKEPLDTWKSVSPGLLSLRKMGATARIASMVSPQLPVVGPLLDCQRAFTCTGSVLFRDNKYGLCKLQEQYVDFKRVQGEEQVQNLIRANKKKTEVAPAAAEAVAAPAAGAEVAASAIDAVAAAVAADASSSSSDAAPSDAASSSSSAAAAPAPVAAARPASPAPAPLTRAEYDPADPPQLWEGRYLFEQVKVSEDAPNAAPTAAPFLKVEYKLLFKAKRNAMQAPAAAL